MSGAVSTRLRAEGVDWFISPELGAGTNGCRGRGRTGFGVNGRDPSRMGGRNVVGDRCLMDLGMKIRRGQREQASMVTHSGMHTGGLEDRSRPISKLFSGRAGFARLCTLHSMKTEALALYLHR
jgi:hypothetical protein